MKSNIDRETPLPLYYQLANIIKDGIATGEMKPGEMIPTEIDLMNRYSISRSTVRHAIDSLVNEGHLRKERPKGTFINYPPIERKFLGNLKCFSEEMTRKGIPHGTQVLEQKVFMPDSYVIDKLQLYSGEQVFYLKRLRTVNESPILVVESYLPYSICPGIENVDFNTHSLYDVLEKNYEIKLRYGNRLIKPKIVDSEEIISYLKLSPGTCISLIESTIYTANNQPVEYMRAEMPGTISIDLG